MSSTSAANVATHEDPAIWHKWCRLCSQDHPTNRNVYSREEQPNSWTSMLAMTVGKYFWVDIKKEDELSNYLCSECFTLMDCLMEFSERVRKVQILFNRLQALKPEAVVNYEELREDCGLASDEWKHIMYRAVALPPYKQEELKTNGMEQQVIVIEQEQQQTQEFVQELHIAGEALQTAGMEEEILEDEGEHLAEEEVETMEEEVQQQETSDCLVEVDRIAEEEFIEESRLTENQVEDFQVNTYEAISQARPHELLRSKAVEEAMEPEDDAFEEETSEEPAPYKCSICKKSYKRPNAYMRHMEEVHKTVPRDLPQVLCNTCPHCEKRFTAPASLRRHIEGFHKQVKPYVAEASDCLVEVEHIAEEDYIEESQIIEEGQVEDFQIETYEVISTAQPAELLKSKAAEEALESDDDTHEDVSSEHLIEDEEEGIPEEPTIYKCSICNKPYKKPKAYMRHMEEVHNTVPKDLPQLLCNQCGLCFPSATQLASHYRTHLPPAVKSDNSCPHCEKRFTTPGTLKRHIEGVHKQIKPYVCDICGKSFNYVTGLKDHKLVHTEECPFECPVCLRRFKNKARLKIHSDTHSAQIYECAICGLKLKTRRTFNKHKLVHSDERQYKCDVCGSAFKRSKTLKAHLILHTGIRPYKCNFCGIDFSNGSNCRSHKRKAHPKELAEEESRGVSRSTLLPMLDELTKASKLIKTPAKPSKTKGSRPKVPPKAESSAKDTDGNAILYELVEELDYS
ncbi:zinc finger protein weckle [Drosophila biarmipes]|uniref:zinc finger protein weckle n=1 Tax=Drosophila biarmipes TaxID=125945 RepID=UPI0007E7FFD1|nr:zinc finger protein weckle [Drosophila biarmipes]XP_043948278.1 zinc finger protein weckle [Drosophila biarmipes]